MSLFFKIERFGADPKLIQIRGLFAQIGEDSHGILSGSAPEKVYFSLYSLDNHYLLRTEVPLSINGQDLSINQQSRISNNTIISVEDFKITAFNSSSTAEALAYSEATISDLTPQFPLAEQFPRLRVKIANLSRTFFLYPGLDLVVGANPESSIMVDLLDLKEKHFLVVNKSENPDQPLIMVRPLQGSVMINEEAITGETLLNKNTRLVLEPSGLELELEL